MGDWWWDTQDQLLDAETILPITCASDKTQLTNVLTTIMPGHLMSRLVIFDKISPGLLQRAAGFSLD